MLQTTDLQPAINKLSTILFRRGGDMNKFLSDSLHCLVQLKGCNAHVIGFPQG